MKRKRRKELRKKKWRRMVRQQGSDVLIGLVTGIITNLLTDSLAKDKDRSRHERCADSQRS